MEAGDLLLAGGAVVGGYYVLKGAGNLANLVKKAPDYVKSETYNALAGLTNQAGLTNTSAFSNEWGEGVAYMETHPSPSPVAASSPADVIAAAALQALFGNQTYVGTNEWGSGVAVMQDTHSQDLIPGLHLW